jgi:hypothetical protein
LNEASYIRAIHGKLPVNVHAWKIADRFKRGVPDTWYSGDVADLWAEYKFLKKTPKRNFKPKLSPLQLKWLQQRHAEGRLVVVIVGTPAGGTVISAKDLDTKIKPDRWLPHQEIAEWIAQTVCS